MAFKLRSGNKIPFKLMGKSPLKVTDPKQMKAMVDMRMDMLESAKRTENFSKRMGAVEQKLGIDPSADNKIGAEHQSIDHSEELNRSGTTPYQTEFEEEIGVKDSLNNLQ